MRIIAIIMVCYKLLEPDLECEVFIAIKPEAIHVMNTDLNNKTFCEGKLLRLQASYGRRDSKSLCFADWTVRENCCSQTSNQ